MNRNIEGNNFQGLVPSQYESLQNCTLGASSQFCVSSSNRPVCGITSKCSDCMIVNTVLASMKQDSTIPNTDTCCESGENARIQCTTSNQITSINWSGMELTSPIRPELGDLRLLQSLYIYFVVIDIFRDLSNNQLYGLLPKELSLLSQLQLL